MFSVFAGRAAVSFPEKPVEIADVLKTAFQCYGQNRHRRAAQQFGRPFQPDPIQMNAETLAGLAEKEAPQIFSVHVTFFCEHLQCQRMHIADRNRTDDRLHRRMISGEQGRIFPPGDEFGKDLYSLSEFFRIGQSRAEGSFGFQPCGTDTGARSGKTAPVFPFGDRHGSGIDHPKNLSVPDDRAGKLRHAEGADSFKRKSFKGFPVGMVLAGQTARQPFGRGFCCRTEGRSVDLLFSGERKSSQTAEVTDRKMCSAVLLEKENDPVQRKFFQKDPS